VRPRAKLTIDSLQEVVYEKSIGGFGAKMNDLDLCLEVVSLTWRDTTFKERSRSFILAPKVMSTIVLHPTLNIPETVRNRGLIPKDHQ